MTVDVGALEQSDNNLIIAQIYVDMVWNKLSLLLNK